MMLKDLDAVVLKTDLPAHGLRRGDIGTVVHVYAPDSIEVEFVRASGRTQALVTLTDRDVRVADDKDMITSRPSEP